MIASFLWPQHQRQSDSNIEKVGDAGTGGEKKVNTEKSHAEFDGGWGAVQREEEDLNRCYLEVITRLAKEI